MKFVLYFFIFSTPLISLHAQLESEKPSHYVFAKFGPGDILMKYGTKNTTSLNYNALSEEMVFEQNGEKLAIADAQLKDIDTVIIANRKFVLQKDKFLEFIEQSDTKLYVEHKCRIKYPGKVNGPGGQTSQTSSSETYATAGYGRIIYEVVLPKGYSITPYKYYWMEKDGKLTRFKNLNQLLKSYPDKKKISKDYVKKNNVDYNNKESVLKLVQYLEGT